MIYHKRSEWELPNQPVKGPALNPSGIVDMMYHYPGAKPLANFSDPIKALRNGQNSYLTDPKRGYSYGYNWVIDLNGEVWEVRGWDIQSAATGGYNGKSVATQFLVPGENPANEKQLAAAVELHLETERRFGKKLGVYGHYQKGTTVTPCPGNGIRSQLPELERRIHAPKPAQVPVLPPVGDDEDMQNAMIGMWKPKGSEQVYQIYALGYKVWVPSIHTQSFVEQLGLLNGKDWSEVSEASDQIIFQAFGPVLGPIPDGHDAWGWPLAS